MFDLNLDDIQKQRNKKYGFNNTCVVLKAVDYSEYSIILLMCYKMSYYSPSGKARMRQVNSYDVRIQNSDHKNLDGSRFNFSSKTEALKYFKSVHPAK